jgi:hypothetical protein
VTVLHGRLRGARHSSRPGCSWPRHGSTTSSVRLFTKIKKKKMGIVALAGNQACQPRVTSCYVACGWQTGSLPSGGEVVPPPYAWGEVAVLLQYISFISKWSTFVGRTRICCGTNAPPCRHVANFVGQHVARLLPTAIRRRVCALPLISSRVALLYQQRPRRYPICRRKIINKVPRFRRNDLKRNHSKCHRLVPQYTVVNIYQYFGGT